MDNKDSKTNLFEHSQAKVRLLGEYLKRYLNIIANSGYTKRIKIYDLFCGEGVYENGGEGSPLVIMRAVKDLHFTNVAKSKQIPLIDCSFNDIDTSKVEKVKQAIKNKSLYYPEFGSIEYNTLDYQEEVERLISELAKLQDQKVFLFIDPYKYKHIQASHIKNLLTNGNTEVLLFLPTQFMYRFDSNGTPKCLKDFIEELVEYKNWKDNDSVWQFIEQLKDSFKKYLGENYFVDTFTIQKEANTVYCLFFFCPHIKGFEKMLETKWEIDSEQGKGWDYTGQQDLFHEKTNALEDKLKTFLISDKRYNGDVYEFTLRAGFLPKHTNEIFYNWSRLGILEVLADQGGKVRMGSFYITYRCFRDENKKVYFRLK